MELKRFDRGITGSRWEYRIDRKVDLNHHESENPLWRDKDTILFWTLIEKSEWNIKLTQVGSPSYLTKR